MHFEVGTERLRVRTVLAEDSEAIFAYYTRNKSHLEPWEPERQSTFYTLEYWSQWQQEAQIRAEQDLGYHFVAHLKGELVGLCNLTNVVRGIFQACNLGYSIDAGYQGMGLAREMVESVIELGFSDLHLHRVMANYIPENERSGKLLANLGFEEEGRARDYLYINGAWRDHILTAKIASTP